MSLKEEHDGIVQEFEEAAARAAEDGLTWTVMSGASLFVLAAAFPSPAEAMIHNRIHSGDEIKV